MNEDKRDKLMLALSMLIFGTIGVFRKRIDLPSEVIACVRGLLGAAVLFVGVRLTGGSFSLDAMKRNLGRLLFSGALIGLNWMLLFEAYRYTSIAVATLMYYMAPVFVIVASALVLRQRVAKRKWICVGVAMLGMTLVSGVVEAGPPGSDEMKGIAFGLAAALLYAIIVLLNGGMKDVGAYDRTVVQLAAAGAVMLPYILLHQSAAAPRPDGASIVFLLIVSIVHTGVAYALYFGSLAKLNVQTVALYSYIDPVTAVLLSAVLSEETLTVSAVVGAALILGATMASGRGDK